MTIVDDALATAARMLAERLGDRVRARRRAGADDDLPGRRVGGAVRRRPRARRSAAVAEVRRATGVPVLVVGRGSNMLVADAGFEGVAISIAGFADAIALPEAARSRPVTAVLRHRRRRGVAAGARPAHGGGRRSPASSGRSACRDRSAARCA